MKHRNRIFKTVAVLCAFTSAVCALWARPKQTASDKCDIAYVNCYDKCNQYYTGAGRNICKRHCLDAYAACLKKAGLPPKPQVASHPPQVMASAAPAASPLSTPIKVQPQGTLTRASPSPKQRFQPQGNLTRTSPTPGMILDHQKKKKRK
jgi:hypothetical protein